MGNQVYANGREVSCKSANGKAIAAFPDVCFTPPQAPPTPMGVPIPYPNTGLASDTTNGTRTVKVTGKEVMLKDKSYFKTSYGDEAGCAPKKGIITSKNKGKIYFTSWSMDVKFEGLNVVRHMDMTTHNHASQPSNTAPWTYLDRMAMADGIAECDKAKKKVEEKCGDTSKKATCPSGTAITKAEKARKTAKDTHGLNSRQYATQNAKVTAEYKAYAKAVQSDPCQRALRCFLSPYKPSRCCPKQTPHHVVDAASFTDGPAFTGQTRDKHPKKTGWKKYNVNKAPCVCAEGPNQTTATHGLMHVRTGVVAQAKQKNGEWTRSQATDAGVKAMTKTFPGTKACEACLKKQLDKYHDSARTTPEDKPINANVEMTADPAARRAAAKTMLPPPRRRR